MARSLLQYQGSGYHHLPCYMPYTSLAINPYAKSHISNSWLRSVGIPHTSVSLDGPFALPISARWVFEKCFLLISRFHYAFTLRSLFPLPASEAKPFTPSTDEHFSSSLIIFNSSLSPVQVCNPHSSTSWDFTQEAPQIKLLCAQNTSPFHSFPTLMRFSPTIFWLPRASSSRGHPSFTLCKHNGRERKGVESWTPSHLAGMLQNCSLVRIWYFYFFHW